jgi:hypothetical protein
VRAQDQRTDTTSSGTWRRETVGLVLPPQCRWAAEVTAKFSHTNQQLGQAFIRINARVQKGGNGMKQGSDILRSGGRFGGNGTKYVVAYSPDDGGRAALAAARLFSSSEVVLAVCAIVPDRRCGPNAAECPTKYPDSMRGPAATPLDEAKTVPRR